MPRVLLSWMLLATLLSFGAPLEAAELVAETIEAAAADPDFSLQGEYVAEQLGVQVVARGKGEFLIVRYPGGLPGAGWNGKDRQTVDGDAETVRALIESLKLTKTERKSPTLGAPAPAGAIVLFDGTQKSVDEHWKQGTLSPAQTLVPAALTKESFTDFTLHLEFLLPYMPEARGQKRANSGLYLQGRYEAQILDSFGLEGKNNECGGLYSVRDPELNMCLPPLVWQTYDVVFTAPRFDETGRKTTPGRVTVRLNGVPVQSDVEVPRVTTGSILQEGPEPGPVFLQDHGNPVRFRNIWIVRQDASRESRRPIVPAYERFHASTSPASPEGGLLLLTELGCINCHASNVAALKVGGSKSGPVLDQVGLRVRADWLAKYLSAPHDVKPGTSMPAVLDFLPPDQRERSVAALIAFLVGDARPAERNGDRVAARRGHELFHSIGCVACHAPRGADAPRVNSASTVPLPVLGDKYSVVALEKFLKDPAAIRPSGRMPSLNLNDKESRDLASFLVSDSTRSARPNINYRVYHGVWENPPDFSSMKPVSTGTSQGFDLSVAGREDAFGIQFEGYWNVEQEGTYQFYLSSDDGSRLYLDDELIARYGGPFTKVPPRVIPKGVHKIRVDYVEAFGEQNLTLEFQGRGITRQPMESWLRLSPEEAVNPAADDSRRNAAAAEPTLAAEGKILFQTLGCANCHRVNEEGKPVETLVAGPALAKLNPAQGCLSDALPAGKSIPNFDLSSTQRASIAAALSALGSQPPVSRNQISATLASFNCYACHQRDGLGGPERDRNPLFLTTQHEIGDEGRVPPPLDGVGDKLQPGWLKKVLNDGAKDRPYMLARMPKFGGLPVEPLSGAMVKADQKSSPNSPSALPEPDHRIKAVGRRLAGNNAFGCVKCHVFGATPSSGIQAMNLLTMTRRVREDWFFRYLVNPQAYRPGTRMPTAFVEGRSVVRDVYEGDPIRQMQALWMFLSDGDKAAAPDGLIAQAIELVPGKTPVIYRNFLDGLTARGIAVGYPEQADLAWDAEKMALAAVWHGKFLDASKHWTGRGADKISPLGDHVIRPETTTPIAVLPSQDTAWPTDPPRTLGYRFRGYVLNEREQPAFQYTVPVADGHVVNVSDLPIPVVDPARPGEPGMRRTLTLSSGAAVSNLYVRIARGAITPPEAAGGVWTIDGGWTVRIHSTPKATPFVRGQGKDAELLVPVVFESGKAEVMLDLAW